MARRAGHLDGDVEAAGVDGEPKALAVTDPAGVAGNGGAAMARVAQRDAGQVADGMRDCDRYLADRDVGAGVPAGRAELRRDSRQVPADRFAAAVSAAQVTLVFEPGAGAGVALRVPAQPTADRLAVDRTTIGRQAAQQRPVIIAGSLPGLSHARNISGNNRPARVSAASEEPGALEKRALTHNGDEDYDLHNIRAVAERGGS